MMRTEAEVRGLAQYYVDDCEGGIDVFAPDSDMVLQDNMCLWCVRLRILRWVLGETDSPDNGKGMADYGHTCPRCP